MSELSNSTKKHLDSIVDKIDDKIERKLDERSVNAHLSKFQSSGRNDFKTALKKAWGRFQDVINRKSIENSLKIFETH